MRFCNEACSAVSIAVATIAMRGLIPVSSSQASNLSWAFFNNAAVADPKVPLQSCFQHLSSWLPW